MKPHHTRDPNCWARDLTQFFGYAFSGSNLIATANAESEEELLAHFKSLAPSSVLRINWWPPGPSPGEKRVTILRPDVETTASA